MSKKTDNQKKSSPKQKIKLVLLDAHAILHRAYHALPDFMTSKGEPTGALYGVTTMLLKIINELKPDYVVACYDLPEPTYRHEAYEDYKAGRQKADPALVTQMTSSRAIFEAFSIPIYEMPGFEADDILGTIVESMKDNSNVDIIIASGDMDTLQLVAGKKVQVYTLRKGIQDTVIYNEDKVKERFGFAPKLLPDFKGLRGDPSDNIIGIKGIGEKTATTLITTFGTIEQIYKKLKKDEQLFLDIGITPRIIKLLKEGEEEALFSKMLALIRRDAPIKYVLPKTTWHSSYDTDKISAVLKNYEFRALIARVKTILSRDTAIKETTDINTNQNDAELNANKNTQNTKEQIQEDLEIQQLSLAVWVLNSSISNATKDEILDFAKCDDLKTAKKVIFKKLNEDKLKKVYEDIELPLIAILEKMQKHGILVDKTYLKQLSADYHKKLDGLEKKIYTIVGHEFNLNSPKQLATVLFDEMFLTTKNLKKTPKGVRSTRESELLKLKGEHEIIDLILEYREYQKLLSTYIDNIPDMLDANGRLHAEFLQKGAITGRMSSKNPNLQNIPVKTELGNNIRKAFTTTYGFKLVALDYSQIELRIATFLSGDSKLIDIFKKGGDIHSSVAEQVFGVNKKDVDKEMRRKAKVINFGILYGMGVSALQQNLGSTRAEAQKFYDDYFNTYVGLAQYLERTKELARQNGYTETFFGRRRYFESINSSLPHIRAMAERMAINAPIQGTQADIIKLAMTQIDKYITDNNLSSDINMLLQVHDELVFEVRESKIDKIVPDLVKIMTSIIDLKKVSKKTYDVPILTGVTIGRVWGDMKSYNVI